MLGSQKTATVTILDNDCGVQFEFNRYWVRETDGALTVRVLRGNDVQLGPFTVDYATSDGSATSGVDYTPASGTLAFAQGEMAKTITVPILFSEALQPDRQFKLTLRNPAGGVEFGPHTNATVTVLDTAGMVAHRIETIHLLPDRGVQLSLSGRVSQRFKDYYDLYRALRSGCVSLDASVRPPVHFPRSPTQTEADESESAGNFVVLSFGQIFNSRRTRR